MLKPKSNGNAHRSSWNVLSHGAAIAAFVTVVASLALAVPVSAQGPVTGKIPELGSIEFAWLARGVHWFDPPAGLRGPIRQDPAYAFHGNLDGPGQVTHDIGNTKDPVLKPWA